MKKYILLMSLILTVVLIFSGCLPEIMVIPDNESVGEPKIFEKDGIKLTLTDEFRETESELGFDAYYVSNFGAVVILKEEFTLKEGLADYSLEEYIKGVIKNNGYTDIEPQSKDDLCYYVSARETRNYSFCFKGSDAFWIVQFLCRPSDAPILEDLIFLWADSVEVE